MNSREELLHQARLYARSNNLAVAEQLGFGVHGVVFVAESQTEPGRSAIKIHQDEAPYRRERDAYLRLQDRGVTRLRNCHVPQLLQVLVAFRATPSAAPLKRFLFQSRTSRGSTFHGHLGRGPIARMTSPLPSSP